MCTLPHNPAKLIQLCRLRHRPQDILDNVKWFTRELDFKQKSHKTRFLKIYIYWLDGEAPEDPRELESLKKDLELAMQALDGYFFGGSFTENGPDRTVDLCVQNNVFEEGQPGYPVALPKPWGLTRALGNGRTRIYIDTLHDGYPRTTHSIFRTLVHEMAHAVYASFACKCTDCAHVSGHPSVLGPRGHGRLWKEMAEHMRNEIQTWDYILSDFWNDGNMQWHHTKWT